MRELELAVILPAFNAGDFIADSLTTLSADLAIAGLTYEILVVDDGSTDDTRHRAELLQDPHIQVLSIERNRGKGAAIKTGLAQARAQHIILTDDDVPYGTGAVLRCYQALRRGAVLAVGDRRLPESRIDASVPLLRRLVSSGNIVLRRLLCVAPTFQDTQCGLKGLTAPFASHVLECSRTDRFSFDLELVVIAAENGVTITRIPVVMSSTLKVSGRLLREVIIACRDVFRIAWHIRRGSYRAREGWAAW